MIPCCKLFFHVNLMAKTVHDCIFHTISWVPYERYIWELASKPQCSTSTRTHDMLKENHSLHCQVATPEHCWIPRGQHHPGHKDTQKNTWVNRYKYTAATCTHSELQLQFVHQDIMHRLHCMFVVGISLHMNGSHFTWINGLSLRHYT